MATFFAAWYVAMAILVAACSHKICKAKGKPHPGLISTAVALSWPLSMLIGLWMALQAA